ncbi:MAG: HIT family protein [Sphaerochaetaceae bacterium]|nr:HIT family protein [Sphaerochaetaceae bacterium]
MEETIFTKIRDGKIPSVTLYKDEQCFVIMDINPIIKGHCLVIADKPYKNIGECPQSVLNHMMEVAKKMDAKLRDVLHCDGTNVMINNDPASGQEVPHLHIHVIPRYTNDGRKFGFAHDKYEEGEMVKLGERLCLG